MTDPNNHSSPMTERAIKEMRSNVINGVENGSCAPIFFLSYPRPKLLGLPATAPEQVNPLVPRLFDDLNRHVNELIPRRPGEGPGFLDVAIRGGTDWQDNLFHAVGTCQVFVALISPNYVHGSQWCAREWDAFTRRKFSARTGAMVHGESPIVPVLWVPVADDQLPPDVAAINRFTPRDLPTGTEAFERNGLYGLLQLGYEDIYRAIVWKLAQHIRYVYSTYVVEPWTPIDAEGLRASFAPHGASRNAPHFPARATRAPRRNGE